MLNRLGLIQFKMLQLRLHKKLQIKIRFIDK